MNLDSNQMALTNYFQACCSVDRLEVDYADIYPDPSALEALDKMSRLTDAGHELLRKIRGMPKPALYPMDPVTSMELFQTLTDLMQHLKQSLAKLGR
jgi:hypothetical protein